MQALQSLFDPLSGLKNFWWVIFGETIGHALQFVYDILKGLPVINLIGAYGVAIVVVTLGIRLVLSPLFHYQLSTSRRNMEQQRRLQPEVAKLRKKYKKEPARLNEETMKLYREHGVNPLASLTGCLPAVAQMPILIALYWVLLQHHGLTIPAHPSFLWIHDLNHDKDYVLAALAGVLTWIQVRMAQTPQLSAKDGEPDPSQQMAQSMQYISPLMIFIFGIQWQAGLPLYWAVSTGFGIIQQYLVTGWGSLPVLGGARG